MRNKIVILLLLLFSSIQSLAASNAPVQFSTSQPIAMGKVMGVYAVICFFLLVAIIGLFFLRKKKLSIQKNTADHQNIKIIARKKLTVKSTLIEVEIEGKSLYIVESSHGVTQLNLGVSHVEA